MYTCGGPVPTKLGAVVTFVFNLLQTNGVGEEALPSWACNAVRCDWFELGLVCRNATVIQCLAWIVELNTLACKREYARFQLPRIYIDGDYSKTVFGLLLNT